MCRIIIVSVVFVMTSLGLASAQEGGPELPWRHGLEETLELAKAEQRPVLICMHWLKEVATKTTLNTVYSDERIQTLMKDFLLIATTPDQHDKVKRTIDGEEVEISKWFGPLTCAQLRDNEIETKSLFFETPRVTVRQHIIVRPDGTVAMRKEYLMDQASFLRFLKKGLTAVAGEASLSYKAELRIHFERVKKGSDKERADAIRAILEVADEKVVVDLYHVLEGIKKEKKRIAAIRTMGRSGLEGAGIILDRWLTDDSWKIRRAAIVSTEERERVSSRDRLLKLYELAKSGEIKREIVRALGPCGGRDPRVKKLLLSKVKTRDEKMRRAVYYSLGFILDSSKENADVRAALKKAFKREGRSLRNCSGIIWAYYRSGDAKLAKDLQTFGKRSRNKVLHERIASATKYLEEGESDPGNNMNTLVNELFAGDGLPRR